MSGAGEFYALAADLEVAGPASIAACRSGIQKGCVLVKATWRGNAAATAGSHGKHYPNAITYETRATGSGAYGEVGPDSGMPQGGMSFEYGSVNQPPHLDGKKAADSEEPVIMSLIDDAVVKALP